MVYTELHSTQLTAKYIPRGGGMSLKFYFSFTPASVKKIGEFHGLI